MDFAKKLSNEYKDNKSKYRVDNTLYHKIACRLLDEIILDICKNSMELGEDECRIEYVTIEHHAVKMLKEHHGIKWYQSIGHTQIPNNFKQNIIDAIIEIDDKFSYDFDENGLYLAYNIKHIRDAHLPHPVSKIETMEIGSCMNIKNHGYLTKVLEFSFRPVQNIEECIYICISEQKKYKYFLFKHELGMIRSLTYIDKYKFNKFNLSNDSIPENGTIFRYKDTMDYFCKVDHNNQYFELELISQDHRPQGQSLFVDMRDLISYYEMLEKEIR